MRCWSLLRLSPALLCLAGVAGCVGQEARRAPPRDAPRAEALERLRQRRYPRAYRGVASVRLRFSRPRGGMASPLVPEGAFSGSAALVLRAPDALRIEPLSPFGAPLMVVVAKGAAFRAYSPARNTAYLGAADKRGIERILGIPLDGGTVVKLLLGDWPAALGGAKDQQVRRSSSAHLLEVRGGGDARPALVELAPGDGHPLRIEIPAEGGDVVVRYGAFSRVGGVWRPSRVEILAGPGGENLLHVSYPPDAEAGSAGLPPDELFRLTPPRGARTIRLGG